MSVIPSQLLTRAVEELSKMPGVGRRTALRLALWMLKQERENVSMLGNAIIRLREEVCYCERCFNISDAALCDICCDPRRDSSQICVVQDIRDVMAIEQTGQYRGLYHVLGGVISPLDGISPADLTIEPLIERVLQPDVHEVIMALNSSIEGDTTTFYLFRRIGKEGLKVTTIARGIPIGDELEYADEVTLGRSIVNRILYEKGIAG
jgi:recombination protein RecR